MAFGAAPEGGHLLEQMNLNDPSAESLAITSGVQSIGDPSNLDSSLMQSTTFKAEKTKS